MQPALLGPCFKTGASPSLMKGGLPAKPAGHRRNNAGKPFR